eukprot:TRINITY_DN5746_c1_g1_i1.p1 TRINITY_DN5746_c1_g1~~TRINITY_DN5746_c1_g1_i1.p1  ORF type:complete len:345 (+),score=70.19 TRINITY_DN5746_c1_g1_i1:87-1121(+)
MIRKYAQLANKGRQQIKTIQRRFRRGREDGDDIPFSSVNKFEWGGAAREGEVHNVEGNISEDDFKEIVRDVLPWETVTKTTPETNSDLKDDQFLVETSSPLRKVADLATDQLSDPETHKNLLKDFPELTNMPAMSQVLGRYREMTPSESRVISDSLTLRDPEALVELEKSAQPKPTTGHQSMLASFNPDTRKLLVSQLTEQLTNSKMSAIAEGSPFQAVAASKLSELIPWEYEHEEPPLPDEFWEMSHSERRFLGLPYKENNRWHPPASTFTEQGSDEINLLKFKEIMDKVRSLGGSKESLITEEIELLREAEDKIFDHIRAKLDDMTPFLDERSAIWKARRQR